MYGGGGVTRCLDAILRYVFDHGRRVRDHCRRLEGSSVLEAGLAFHVARCGYADARLDAAVID